jgi:hypothetical protein
VGSELAASGDARGVITGLTIVSPQYSISTKSPRGVKGEFGGWGSTPMVAKSDPDENGLPTFMPLKRNPTGGSGFRKFINLLRLISQ